MFFSDWHWNIRCLIASVYIETKSVSNSQLSTPNVFQEDISKLRSKIEKAKKPAEKISNGDDILNEEISDYKVNPCETKIKNNFSGIHRHGNLSCRPKLPCSRL